MITWPEQLVQSLSRKRGVIYLGAGVSAGSISADDPSVRPPDWLTFLKTCLDKYPGNKDTIQSLLDSKDYLTACRLLKSNLKDDWNELLNRAFARPKYVASETHQAIFQLDSRLVVTPNFDKIYDVYAQHESGQTVRICHYYDVDAADIMRGDYRGILKIHGTIDQPSKTIFTRKDYSNLRYEYASFQSLLDALLLTHTFFFVGSSLQDPDLVLFLENHASAHPLAPTHFMTSPIGEIPEERDEAIAEDLNLRLLRYDPDNGHAELTSSLQELVVKVQENIDELAQTQQW